MSLKLTRRLAMAATIAAASVAATSALAEAHTTQLRLSMSGS